MVNEDHAKDVIDIQEFKGVYPEGTKVFVAAVGGNSDEVSFKYEEVVKSFRDAEGWGDFIKVRQVIKDMKEAMFNAHFEGLCDMMDKDHNDTLDFTEFQQIYPLATKIFFDELDTNGDNKLQKSELRASFVLADGSMDVARMAQIEADMKEKIEAKTKKIDNAIDDFLEADEKDALSPLSPDDFTEFEEPEQKQEPERTPEKKAETPVVVEEKKEETPVKVEETPKKVEQNAPKELQKATPKESEKSSSKKVEETASKEIPTSIPKKAEKVVPQKVVETVSKEGKNPADDDKDEEEIKPAKPASCCIIS